MKKNILLFIKLGLTFGILYLITRKINFNLIYRTFLAPDLLFLIISVILVIPNFALKFWKWNILLKTSGIQTNMFISARSYLAGLAIGIATPARVGEVGRAFFLPQKEKLQGAGVVVVDKIFDLISIIFLSLLGARILIQPSTFYLLIFCVFAGTGILLFSRTIHQFIVPPLSKYSFGTKLEKIFSIFTQLSRGVIAKNLVITLAMFVVVLLQCFFLVKTFYAGHLTFNAILFAYPLVIVANILPITLGGLGVREGVAVFTLSIFAIPGEIAVSATLYLFLINVVFPSIIGCIIIAGAGKSFEDKEDALANQPK